MPVPVNHVGMSDIQTEYGGSSSDGISLTEYYRGDQYVPLNQLPSIHGAGPIPLVSGGKTQTISIGMFRGTAKQFEWVFNITQNRFTTFNLYNELVAVGWDQTVPIKVTINVFNGVYVVSETTSVPTMDFRGPFAASSEVMLNNNGFIFGRGGKGGYAGVYPNVSPSDGENGGDALNITVFTTIFNNGVIAGGGGGGGATTATSFPLEHQSSETITNSILRYNGRSGGGGAPFGAAGDPNPQLNGTFEAYFIPGDFRGFAWGGIRDEGHSVHHNPPTAASLINGGSGSSSSFQDASYSMQLIGAKGGQPGEFGEPGHNHGGFSGTGSGDYILVNEGTPSQGGNPGSPIIGGENVTWTKFGKVKGKLQFPIGAFRNSQNYNVLAHLQYNSVRTNNQGFTAGSISAPKESYVTSSPGIGGAPGASVLGNPWVIPQQGIYSYSKHTNLTNQGINATLSPRGSPIYIIKYSMVVDHNSYNIAYLEGCVDDRISSMQINGITTQLTFPNGQLNINSIRSTGTFALPTNGPFVISVWIIDTGGGSRNIDGNMHMFSLQLKSAPFGFIIGDADQWIVDSVQNY